MPGPMPAIMALKAATGAGSVLKGALGAAGVLGTGAFLGHGALEGLGFNPLGSRRRARKTLEMQIPGLMEDEILLNLLEGEQDILEDILDSAPSLDHVGTTPASAQELEDALFMQDLLTTHGEELAQVAQVRDAGMPSFAEVMMRLGVA